MKARLHPAFVVPAFCLQTLSSSSCRQNAEVPLCSTNSALVVCPNDAHALSSGIDVSHWQGDIQWPAVQYSGQTFAIARVSDGLNTLDRQFYNNWPAMADVGLVRGVYQYFRPAQDPIAQANMLLDHVQRAGGFGAQDLPPVLDIETIDGVALNVLLDRALAWLQHVEAATQQVPLIYTSNYFAGRIGLDTRFHRYGMWAAHWTYETQSCPNIPNGWNTWAIWQYSDRGAVSGISGDVDLNVFNGDQADLLAYTRGPDVQPDSDAGVTEDVDAGEAIADAGTTIPGDDDAGLEATDAGATKTMEPDETWPMDMEQDQTMGAGDPAAQSPHCR